MTKVVEKLLSQNTELLTPKTEEETQSPSHVETNSPVETDPKRDTTPLQTADTTTHAPHGNVQQENPQDSELHEKDEHTLEAVDGLLMLQNLKPADQETTKKTISLIPLAVDEASNHEKDEHSKPSESEIDTPELPIPEEELPNLEPEETLPNDDLGSDETIIYEPPQTDSQVTAEREEENTPKKGTLTIIEVGIPKPGTSTENTTTEAMPVITTAGKVQCDFCKRSFNTLTEQKQHMVRRHLVQLNKKREDLQREKDKQILQDKNTDKAKQEVEHEKTEHDKRQEKLEKDKQDLKHKDRNSKGKRDTKPVDREQPKNRNRKRKHEKDKPTTTTTKKAKTQPPQQTVHTKRRPVNRKPSSSSDRTYNCRNCEKSYDTQSELNHHHKQKHPPVQCTICKQLCATPNTLDRHMYKHKGTLSCQYCDEKFAFRSEVETHMAKHQDESTHYCRKCTKSFKRIGELREHEYTHTNKLRHCPIKDCPFSAKLKRYIRIHLKTTHADDENLPYPCKYKGCDRSFKFYEQRKRHYNNDH